MPWKVDEGTKRQIMRNLQVILLWFNQSPPSSSTTAPEPVDLQELKGKLQIGVMKCQRKLLCPELWIGSSFYGNCKTIAGFWIQAAGSLSLVFKEWPCGGLYATTNEAWVRHTVCSRYKRNLHKAFHQSTRKWRTSWNASTFLFPWMSFTWRRFLRHCVTFFWRHSSVLIFSHYLEFFPPYIFTYARRPYTVHV